MRHPRLLRYLTEKVTSHFHFNNRTVVQTHNVILRLSCSASAAIFRRWGQRRYKHTSQDIPRLY